MCTYILVPGSEFNNWNSSWKQLAGLMQSLMQSVPIDATLPLQPKEFWVSRQWRQFLKAASSPNNLPYYNQVGLRAAQDLTLWWSIPMFAGQQCIDEHDMKMCQMKCITICFELDYPWNTQSGYFLECTWKKAREYVDHFDFTLLSYCFRAHSIVHMMHCYNIHPRYEFEHTASAAALKRQSSRWLQEVNMNPYTIGFLKYWKY